jgi:hypothetical protein
LENRFSGYLLEWVARYFAKPYMAVFEAWEEGYRGDSKPGCF